MIIGLVAGFFIGLGLAGLAIRAAIHSAIAHGLNW